MGETERISWPGWEKVRLIGKGSFGAVYEIQRELFGETEKAALKVITIPQSDSDIEEMYSDGYDEESITSTFQNHLKSIISEYTLMRKLNGSANVVNCDDVRYVQHDDGIGWDIYIKMELLTPLNKVLPENIPEEQVLAVGRDICRALVLCKEYNIVHRDIKPQNIFVSEHKDYKLGDFGIAKTVEKTSGGTKIGTYKYMAPEVYHDEPYGASADIYSLGLVLYWMLNERRMPFLPLPPEKLSASAEENARRRRLSGECIPAPAHGSEDLKRIVLKACAYDPKDRYQSAAEMLSALEGLGKPAGQESISPAQPAEENDDRTEGFGWIAKEQEPEEEKTVGVWTKQKNEPEPDKTAPAEMLAALESIGKPRPAYTPAAAWRDETTENTRILRNRRERAEEQTVLLRKPGRERTAGSGAKPKGKSFAAGTAILCLGVLLLAAAVWLGVGSKRKAALPEAAQETKQEQVTPVAEKPAASESVFTPVPEHVHSWVDATCDTPKTCSGCGETEGEPLGHNWLAATCTKPTTCERCDATQGEPLGHKWEPATFTTPMTCSVCKDTSGEPIPYNKISVEAEVLSIRETYNVIESNVKAGYYRKVNLRKGVNAYYNSNDELVCATVTRGTDGIGSYSASYTRYYYFDQGKVFFAFFEGSDYHRLYFYEGLLMRWRHTASDYTVVDSDFTFTDDFYLWQNLALDEIKTVMAAESD